MSPFLYPVVGFFAVVGVCDTALYLRDKWLRRVLRCYGGPLDGQRLGSSTNVIEHWQPEAGTLHTYTKAGPWYRQRYVYRLAHRYADHGRIVDVRTRLHT